MRRSTQREVDHFGLGRRLNLKAPVAVALAAGLPNISIAMLWAPLNVMQGIYIRDYGISMATMAAILLASRVYDAVADVSAGAVSDYLKARTGRRKPMVAIGALLFAVAGLFIYMPPANADVMYLTVGLFAFFTGFSAVSIPYYAWGSELAQSSHSRTTIMAFRLAAGYLGLCAFYVIPLVTHPSNATIDAHTLRTAAFLSIALFAPSLCGALIFAPEGKHPPTPSPSPATMVRAIISNRPFRLLITVFCLCGLGNGIWYGMIFVFVDRYLQQGAVFAQSYLLAFAASAIATMLWRGLAKRYGKRFAWTCGMSLTLATALATSALNPGNANAWSIGMLLVANATGAVTLELFVPSILGDISDYSLFKTRHNYTATYFSLHMFVTKVLFAVGAALGLAVAAWLGFDPHASTQSEAGVRAMIVVMSAIPAPLIAAALIAIWFVPIDERQHGIVQRRLQQRLFRAQRDKHPAEIEPWPCHGRA